MPTKNPALLARALAEHRAGRLASAERIYRSILAESPRHAEALHLLGLVAAEAGAIESACSLIARAIREQGAHPLYCRNLGQLLLEQGRTAQALACFAQALELEPHNVHNWARLGRALLAAGRLEEAGAALEQAIRLAPALAQAHFDRGNLFHLQRRFADSAACYRAALHLQPDHAAAAYNLGVACLLEKQLAPAAAAFRQALRAQPGHVNAHNNLGTVLQLGGDLRGAMACYRQALALQPESVDARYNLALAQQEAGHLEEALATYEAVLRLEPSHAPARTNYGNVLLALGHPEQALAAYRLALQADPEQPEARWSSALAQLLTGNYRDGWEGYEWRFRQREALLRSFAAPPWDGQPLEGRRILLHTEQGFGDAIQFVRYVPLVKQMGGIVLLECPRELAALLASVPGVDGIVQRGAPLPPFDCHAPLLSLPRLFGTTVETVPASIPYLAPPCERLPKWEERMQRYAAQRRVGLVWSGNPRHRNDRSRSLPAQELAVLAGLPGTVFFSLQKSPEAPLEDFLIDLAPELDDFADTAAAIQHLDLVISADTAVAHLAGALGKPVWTLLSKVPDWRWMLEREDTPWYPTMRLFRQAARDDWKTVLRAVRRALGEVR